MLDTNLGVDANCHSTSENNGLLVVWFPIRTRISIKINLLMFNITILVPLLFACHDEFHCDRNLSQGETYQC